MADEWLVDADGDGYAESIYGDINGDGIVDYSINDFNLDGQFETVGLDRDGDGLADEIHIDTDGDGVLDQGWYRDDLGQWYGADYAPPATGGAGGSNAGGGTAGGGVSGSAASAQIGEILDGLDNAAENIILGPDDPWKPDPYR